MSSFFEKIMVTVFFQQSFLTHGISSAALKIQRYRVIRNLLKQVFD